MRNHLGARYSPDVSGVSMAEGTGQSTRRGWGRDQVRLGKPRQPTAPPGLPAIRPQPCARLGLTGGGRELYLAAGGAGELSGYSLTILPTPRSHTPLIRSSPGLVRCSAGLGLAQGNILCTCLNKKMSIFISLRLASPNTRLFLACSMTT